MGHVIITLLKTTIFSIYLLLNIISRTVIDMVVHQKFHKPNLTVFVLCLLSIPTMYYDFVLGFVKLCILGFKQETEHFDYLYENWINYFDQLYEQIGRVYTNIESSPND